MKHFTFLTNWSLRNSEQVKTRTKPGKNHIQTSLCFVAVLCTLLTVGVGNAWGTVYSGTIPKITSYTSYTISSVSWTVSGTSTAALNQNVDGTKGAQIGTGASPATSLSFSTSGISGTITSITVYTSGAKSVSATVAVQVGSTSFKNGGNTSVSITNSNTGYTFTGSASGTITISWNQTSSKALYVKSISVTYSSASCDANPSIGDASLNGSFF